MIIRNHQSSPNQNLIYSNNFYSCFYRKLIVYMCVPACPTNYEPNSNDKCECVANTPCPPNKQWNSHTCKCECVANALCPPNKLWNQSKCQCVCVFLWNYALGNRNGTVIHARVSVLLTHALLELTPYQIIATALVAFQVEND